MNWKKVAERFTALGEKYQRAAYDLDKTKLSHKADAVSCLLYTSPSPRD